MAPDGATVREGCFESTEAAWERAQGMGSRWFFYPVSLVTGEAGTSDRARIVDAPRELRPFIGKSVGTLRRWFAANSEMVCDWLNRKAPFESPFPYQS